MTRTGRPARTDRWSGTRWRRMRWVVAGIILILIVGLVAGVELWQSRTADQRVIYQPGELAFADTFDRTIAKGWGETATGQTYVVNSPDDLSVFDGTARVDMPKPRIEHLQTLAGLETDDALVSVDLLAPAAAKAGNGTYFSVQVRSDGTNYYRVQLRFAPRGQVAMSIAKVTGGTEVTDLAAEKFVATGVSPGDTLTLDLQVAGASPVQLRAGIRQPGVPRQWQQSVDDDSAGRLVTRGAISLRSYLGGSTEAPKQIRLDSLQVWRLVSQTVPAEQSSAVPTAGPVSFGAHAATVGVALPDVGADGVGTARYPVPVSTVLFVSPDGSDSAPGSIASPLETLAEAVKLAGDGATIVLRQGVYHESVIMPIGKRLTVQPYPGESVWLDGSTVVSDWSREGNVWIAEGWNHFFDASPTYTRGAPDGTEPGWQFVDPAHPMAAHPDQVWVGSTRQIQVATRDAVTNGTFFVDQQRKELVLGTDPDGATVRASTLSKALTVAGRGSVVRGIGIRRYATSVWQLGAVTVNAPDVRLENLTVTDNATTGLSVIASDVRLAKITSLRNGMLGLHAHHADHLVATGLLAAQNNLEGFNRAPVAGGMKITSSRHPTVDKSAFVDNVGNGLWFDESCYRVTVTNSLATVNAGSGLVAEMSSRAVVVGNTLTSNVGSGLMVLNTDRVEVANNTVSNNEGGISVKTGDRSAAAQRAARDSRTPNDPAMVWISRNVLVYNNLVEGRGRCLVCVEDQRARPTPAITPIRFEHNVYDRASAPSGAFAVWPIRGRPVEYPTFADYRAGTGQDAHSREVDNRMTKPLAEQPEVLRTLSGTARTLSPTVAEATDRPASTRRIGAWTSFSS